MANKKKETSTTIEKKQIDKVVDAELKDDFVSAAQETTFTEDDIKELKETSKNVDDELNKIEHKVENKVVNTEESEISDDIVETVNEYVVCGEEITDTEECCNEIQEQLEDKTDTVVEEKQIHKKERSTTREIYGYHWMGIVYDE